MDQNVTPRIWFTSDLHFFHKNILKFCPTTRHGDTADEMTEFLIQAWNSRVNWYDTVFNLGDVSFGSKKKTIEVLERLNGQHHLIYGNHDKVIRRDKAYRECFASVQDVLEIEVEIAKDQKRKIFMSHFPHRTWLDASYGAYHLFGHVHGELPEPWGRSMDVGINSRPLGDMCPWSLEEVVVILEPRETTRHHGD